MKPVFQTRYGAGQGNCLTACVASILETTIDALPEFCDAKGAEWFDRLYDYCKRHDLSLIYWSHKDDVPIIALNAFVILEMALEGIDAENHAVIGKTARSGTFIRKDGSKAWEWETDIVHDPSEKWHPPFTKPVGYIMIGKNNTPVGAVA